MPQLPTAAIIGAGSSGIAAAKALHERGIPFDCFEASDRIGGNWVFGNRNGMSAAYRDLHINTSRDRMQFSDFPMPRSCPDFPHHTDIAAYFESYVDAFGFRDKILFETAIERAELRAGGGWELTDAAGVRRGYDMLLVANGHHWDARWPEPAFAGSDEFGGTQLHAHGYRDNEFLADKDVVVLGMGNSAMDIAVESSYVARSTHLAARRGAWIVPKYLFGRPVDQFATSPGCPFPLAAKVFELMLRDHDRAARALRPARARSPHQRRAPDDLRADPRRIAHGAIAPRPNIARLGPDWVQFTDGVRVHADVVIYCTGYRISFPFLDPDLVSAPDNRIELYRRVFSPQHPTLAFVGLLQPIGAIMPLAEAQGRLLADYLRGAYRLPSRARMHADIRRENAAMRKRYVASQRHTIQVDFDRYLFDSSASAGAARPAPRGGLRFPWPCGAGGPGRAVGGGMTIAPEAGPVGGRRRRPPTARRSSPRRARCSPIWATAARRCATSSAARTSPAGRSTTTSPTRSRCFARWWRRARSRSGRVRRSPAARRARSRSSSRRATASTSDFSPRTPRRSRSCAATAARSARCSTSRSSAPASTSSRPTCAPRSGRHRAGAGCRVHGGGDGRRRAGGRRRDGQARAARRRGRDALRHERPARRHRAPRPRPVVPSPRGWRKTAA